MSYMAAADIIIINIINIIINVPDSLCSLSSPFFKTCGRCGVLNDVFCETSYLCVNHTHYTRHLNELFCLNTLKNSRPQTREPMLWKFQLHFCVLGLIPSLHNILEALLFNPFIKSIKKKRKKKQVKSIWASVLWRDSAEVLGHPVAPGLTRPTQAVD